MSNEVVTVPDVGEGIAEVELISWSVAEGSPVERNQIIAEVMTDKATVEVPAPKSGIVSNFSAQAGETIQVGAPLFNIGDEVVTKETNESTTSAQANKVETTTAATAATVVPQQTEADAKPAANNVVSETEAVKASPAVRRAAQSNGVDLAEITASGPNGRVTAKDLERKINGSDKTQTTEKLVGLRRIISDRLSEASSTIPHITYVEQVDITALQELRKQLNNEDKGRPHLTFLPFLVRALTKATTEYPKVNAHFDGETLTTHTSINVGIATQTAAGLTVPVVANASSLTIWELAKRIADLAERSRTNKVKPEELSGSTITISSLGALGGVVSTPIINKPEVAIVGINKIAVAPVWQEGQFVPRKVMNLSSSFDHRVIDGWDAAIFIQAVKKLLETPALLFIDG